MLRLVDTFDWKGFCEVVQSVRRIHLFEDAEWPQLLGFLSQSWSHRTMQENIFF